MGLLRSWEVRFSAAGARWARWSGSLSGVHSPLVVEDQPDEGESGSDYGEGRPPERRFRFGLYFSQST